MSSPPTTPPDAPPARPRLGLLMLATQFPRPLGDVGHPQTFGFAVRRQVVPRATPQQVVQGLGQPAGQALLQPFIAAGLALVAQGCDAISTSCGFLALWQAELSAALPVPVWTSSLLQLAPAGPLAPPPAALPLGRRCGVITIDAASLTPAHWRAVGADPATPVEGITPGSALHRTLLHDLPTLDMADAQAQVLAAGRRLLARAPQLNTLVLECTNLPPYAAALQQATGLEVLDVVSLLKQRMAALGRQAGAQVFANETPTPGRGQAGHRPT